MSPCYLWPQSLYHMSIEIHFLSSRTFKFSFIVSMLIICTLLDFCWSFSFYIPCFFISLIIAISFILAVFSIFSILLVMCWNAFFYLRIFLSALLYFPCSWWFLLLLLWARSRRLHQFSLPIHLFFSRMCLVDHLFTYREVLFLILITIFN